MPRYIVGHGLRETDIIEAASINAALAEAIRRTQAAGLEATPDLAWAEAYTVDRAYDLGLLVIEELSPSEAYHKAKRLPWGPMPHR